MRGRHRWRALAGLSLFAYTQVSLAAPPGLEPPAPDARSLAYDERPGARLPVHERFIDADGRAVSIEQLARGLPVLLIPAYFHCPNLCGVVRASLFHALASTDAVAGRDYSLLALSIAPAETPSDARAARARDLAAFPLRGGSTGWHYLTGTPAQVGAVLHAIGFKDRPSGVEGQYLHPAGLVALTPAGTVSSYLLGVGYTPVAVRSALARAGAGRIAAASEPLLLLCFHYDALTGRYSLEILKVLRLAALLCVLTLGGMLVLLWRRGAHP